MIGFINQIIKSRNNKATSKHVDKIMSKDFEIKEVKKTNEEQGHDEIDTLLYHYFAVDVDEDEPEDSFIFI